MNPADVTICIPTWQAEPFIARTLQCATAQTHGNVRILVSVDHCEDATETVCRAQAALDPRIEVIAQRERLGWSENANALLERVDTEFFFLYFHDDIIAPDYTAQLRQALCEQPDAMSAHCDLERFGKQQGVDPGNHYHGSAARRLLNFMAGPVKGTPLRSLTRSDVIAQGLRFPEIGDAGFWRCHPFVFTLLGAGPALHVPQVLYRRWFRDGSMTTSWGVRSSAPLLEGQRASAALCLQQIERAALDSAELEILRFALYVFIMTWTRREELRLATDELIEPATISPVFAHAQQPPVALALQDPEIQGWLRASHELLQTLEHQWREEALRRRSVA